MFFLEFFSDGNKKEDLENSPKRMLKWMIVMASTRVIAGPERVRYGNFKRLFERMRVAFFFRDGRVKIGPSKKDANIRVTKRE